MALVPAQPGVFAAEVPTRPAIERAATSVAAFVDTFRQGPLNQATKVDSWKAFTRVFGPQTAVSQASCGVDLFFRNGGQTAWIVRVDGEAEPDAAQLLGDGTKTGLSALGNSVDFNLLCVPAVSGFAPDDGAYPKLVSTLVDFCAARRAFLILDAPRSLATPSAISDWASAIVITSPDAALYVPALTLTGRFVGPRLVGVSGAVAGIYARTDTTRGVWHAPAGMEAAIRGARPAIPMSDAEQARLNPLGINAIRTFSSRGTVVWGARTLDGADSRAGEWKYVSVRRTVLFIERSLIAGLTWTVFEPNGPILWAAVRNAVGDFMHGLFRAGAFAGKTEPDAYYVKCDEGTITRDDVAAGELVLEVGVALLRPAEFTTSRLRLRAAPSA